MFSTPPHNLPLLSPPVVPSSTLTTPQRDLSAQRAALQATLAARTLHWRFTEKNWSFTKSHLRCSEQGIFFFPPVFHVEIENQGHEYKLYFIGFPILCQSSLDSAKQLLFLLSSLLPCYFVHHWVSKHPTAIKCIKIRLLARLLASDITKMYLLEKYNTFWILPGVLFGKSNLRLVGPAWLWESWGTQ